MKKRILSAVIALCMLMSFLPTGIMAYDTREEELAARYEEMLDLGLIDGDGALIEDNAFRLDDGTGFDTLSALEEWMNTLSESDADIVVTVVSTGKSATVAEIAQAISIEREISEIAEELNLLASGDGVSTQAMSYVSPRHGLNLHIEESVDGDILKIEVSLYNTSGKYQLWGDDETITVEAGLFADIFGAGVEADQADLRPENSDSLMPGLNMYSTFTFTKNRDTLVFEIDIAKVRNNYLKLSELIRKDLLNGAEPIMFSCRVVDGAKKQSGSYLFAVEPPPVQGVGYMSYVLERMGDLTPTHNYSDPPYKIDTDDSNMTKETIDSKEYYKINMDYIQAVGFDTWTYSFEIVHNLGTGDGEEAIVGFSSVEYETTYKGELKKNTDILFYKESDVLTSAGGSASLVEMSDGTKKLVITGIQIPVSQINQINDSKCWYLSEDWADGDFEIKSVSLPGTMSLVDTKAPTVVSITSPSGTYYPGDLVPIYVKFSEPVYGDYELVVTDGTTVRTISSAESRNPAHIGTEQRNNPVAAAWRTFYYQVNEIDSTAIYVKGVKGLSDAEDIRGNAFKNDAGDYQQFEATLADGELVSCRPEDSIDYISTGEAFFTETTVKVILKNDEAYKQLWSAWKNKEKDFTVGLVIDWDIEHPFDLEVKEDDNGDLYLEGKVKLDPVNSSTNHSVEICIDGKTVYGKYNTTLWQKPVIKADETAYTLTCANWPSGTENTVFFDDVDTATISAVSNNKEISFADPDQFYWVCSDTGVISLYTTVADSDDMTLASNPSVGVIANGVGEAEIYLMAKNGSDDTKMHTVASNTIKVTVKDGGRPSLLFPAGANTVFARQGADQKVNFASNLGSYDPEDGKINAELKDAAGNTVWTSELDRTATSLTIPGNVLTEISRGDAESYTLKLTASATVNGKDIPLSTSANIIVRSKPSAITLVGLDSPQFVAGNEISFGWIIENFDLGNNPDTCKFSLAVEKDGKIIARTDDAGNGDGQKYSGSIAFTPETPAKLKDYYIVTAKAKNSSDPTWSAASCTIVVYKDGALEILVGGESVDETTLENKVADTSTSTAPTIVNHDGENFTGLTDAYAIAKLRSELGLLETISINYSDYDWSTLNDSVKWSTTTGQGAEITSELERAVTVNYRRGSVYEPLEKFSYTSYIPQIVMMLCGLRDGTNIVTASHASLDGLSDSVRVNVNRLKDQLYLFQFTPAVKTEISYEDSLGVTHTVYSNDDGSLALYEPDRIASEIRCASVSADGTSYRGTFSNISLKSGEGDGTKGELYPLNALTLRLAATAEITLLKPDGTALADTDVTLRGGVYRNDVFAEYRDDAYCETARFARAAGETANLDGRQDMVFRTDANGVLRVHMDLEQFISRNDPDPVGVGDTLKFIFEVRFADGTYYPELVTVNGSLSVRDTMRSGENIITLVEADGEKPFIASATVDYLTGRKMSVRYHTGVVGPSSNYPTAKLENTVMLWGVDGVSTSDTGYYVDLRSQENAVSMPGQTKMTVRDSSYPFSSIPLVTNSAVLDADSFIYYRAEKKTPMELAVYGSDGTLTRTLPLSFGLVDMNAIEKVEDSPSLLSLMAHIGAYGRVGGADTDYDIVNSASDAIMNDALTFLTKLGAEAGLVKAVLLPTEDPTRYTGYLWTGINTTKLEDLSYDEHGISLEPSYFGQDTDSLVGQINDTFQLSDFQAMADGSYFDDRSSLYGTVSSAIGMPIMLILEGWLNTEIRYNFDRGEWEVLTTGGGFTAGGQLEYEKVFNAKKIPITASFKVRGGITVGFEAAVRYAEQLGLEWSDETATAVNDYLTALRINAYLEFFGGLGYDKGFTAKIGVFGTIEINNENRFLTRKYLKNPDERNLKGQYLQLNGEAGIKAALGVGPLVTEITLISLGYKTNRRFNDWDEIYKYWNEASSGLGTTGWMEGQPEGHMALYSVMAIQNEIIVSEPVTRLQSRDYLDDAVREWNTGSGISLYAVNENGGTKKIVSNAYPYGQPLISDDDSMLVLIDDGGSKNVTDTRIGYLTGGTTAGYQDMKPIPDGADGFSGYGDSSPYLDGDSHFAGAVWLRESATLGLKAGSNVTVEQQAALLNGLEVMASIWNGSGWTTTRLTVNGTQELLPVIAVNGNKAIAAWRSVQSGDSLYEFEQDRILCKIYYGNKWSDETYTLYNGSNGSVTGLAAEMLDDGTAALAFSVGSGNDSEVYYMIVDINATDIENSCKTIRATTNSVTDESPELTTAGGYFVLGWHRSEDISGTSTHDVGLRVFDKNGAPVGDMPETLGSSVDTAKFDGRFTLTDGATGLDGVSVVYNNSGAGNDSSDIIRMVKFVRSGNGYTLSAPTEAAVLPANTSTGHFDAYTDPDGMTVGMVMNAVTYSTTEFDNISFEYEIGGKTQTGTGKIPKETVSIYSSNAFYENKVGVTDIYVDFTTLAADSFIPVSFTVENQGIDTIDSVTVSIVGSDAQTFDNLSIAPGKSAVLSAVAKTNAVITDLDYTITANFNSGGTNLADGKIYLDYPDVGISSVRVTGEADGKREFLTTLYNQSAASLDRTDRRVVLGVYSDPSCETPVNGKYFEGGETDKAYEVIISGDALSAIDGDGYAKKTVFNIGGYISDAKLEEIPDSGVNLFVKTRVEQKVGEDWITLPEADTLNNQKTLTFNTHLTGDPVTLSVELDNSGNGTAARITVRNNSLKAQSGGRLIAALLGADGGIVETKNLGNVQLDGEQTLTFTVNFTGYGSRVVVRFADGSSETNKADAKSITIDGLPLSLDNFDENDKAILSKVPAGRYLLTVVPESSGATVRVNGAIAENGMFQISTGYTDMTVLITITSADRKTSRNYTIEITPESTDDGGFILLIFHSLSFETNGGSEIDTLRKLRGTRIDLSGYVPTKDGYIFTGWYADSSLTEKVTSVDLNSDTTVYAGWLAEAGTDEPDTPDSPDTPDTPDKPDTTGHPALPGEVTDVVNPFVDVYESDWFYDDVMFAYGNGILIGTAGDMFSPFAKTTRAMIAVILWRMEGSPGSEGKADFTDVPDDTWFTDAVAWAYENGIFKGYGDGRFGALDSITREQLATILYRFAVRRGYDVTMTGEGYEDNDAVAEYSIEAARWACVLRLFEIGIEGKLEPKQVVSRMEIAVALHRFCAEYRDDEE